MDFKDTGAYAGIKALDGHFTTNDMKIILAFGELAFVEGKNDGISLLANKPEKKS